MNGFLERLLGNEDPMAEIVRHEMAYTKKVESYCFEHLSVEEDEAERSCLNDGLGRSALLHQQAKTIRRQIRSWGVLRHLYDDEILAKVGLRNVEAIEKFLTDSSELRRRFNTVVR